MRSLLRGWRSRHLVAAWVAYWAALLIAALGSAIPVAWRVRDSHGSFTAGINDGLASVSIASGGTTLWSGAVDVGTAVLWIAGPPLLLWLVWLISRPRTPLASPRELDGAPTMPALDAARWERNAQSSARAPEPEAAELRRDRRR